MSRWTPEPFRGLTPIELVTGDGDYPVNKNHLDLQNKHQQIIVRESSAASFLSETSSLEDDVLDKDEIKITSNVNNFIRPVIASATYISPIADTTMVLPPNHRPKSSRRIDSAEPMM